MDLPTEKGGEEGRLRRRRELHPLVHSCMLCHTGAEFPFRFAQRFPQSRECRATDATSWGYRCLGLKLNKIASQQKESITVERIISRELADNSEKSGGTWRARCKERYKRKQQSSNLTVETLKPSSPSFFPCIMQLLWSCWFGSITEAWAECLWLACRPSSCLSFSWLKRSWWTTALCLATTRPFMPARPQTAKSCHWC